MEMFSFRIPKRHTHPWTVAGIDERNALSALCHRHGHKNSQVGMIRQSSHGTYVRRSAFYVLPEEGYADVSRGTVAQRI